MNNMKHSIEKALIAVSLIAGESSAQVPHSLPSNSNGGLLENALEFQNANNEGYGSIKSYTGSSQAIEWGSVKLVQFWLTLQLIDGSGISQLMPGEPGASWGIEWELPLPSGMGSEYGSVRISNGKDLVLEQSIDGNKDMTNIEY